MLSALGVILLCSIAGLHAEATGGTCTQLIFAELYLRQQLLLSVTALANSSVSAEAILPVIVPRRRSVCEQLSFSLASDPINSCCGLILNQARPCS
jgi:hypothetical protein